MSDEKFIVVVAATRSNDPEVHSADCGDVQRGLRSGKYQSADKIHVASVEDAADWFWADFLPGGCAYGESDYHPGETEDKRGMQHEDALGYTRFLPCTKGLK